jgi:sirohydrochlorin ferrochelatase
MPSATYLIDNGSLRPASYQRLCFWADALSEASGKQVLPVSLLHSSKIDPELLGGKRAFTWERKIKADINEGIRDFHFIPYFFGPTAAFTQYMPERLAVLRERFGEIRCRRAPFLAGDLEQPDDQLLNILESQITQTINQHSLHQPHVVLVDHGSPQPEVTRVRDRIAERLKVKMTGQVADLVASSMERRPGPEYAFNEPLLETVLRSPGYNTGTVVVALLFLSPGRHAGPEGDVATICREAESEQPRLKTVMTPLVGDHPDLLNILKARLEAESVEI